MKSFISRVSIATLVLGSLLLAKTALGQISYDLSHDFSLASNPNGAWAYGAVTALGGPFITFGYTQTSISDNGVPVDYWLLNPMSEPNIEHNGTTLTSTSDGGQGVYPPGTTILFPSRGLIYYYTVARFTVPTGQSGNYQLQSSAHTYLNGSLSGDTEFHVLDNSSQIFGQFIAPNSGTTFSTTLNLAAGETIDFAVGRGLDGIGDWSGAIVTATLTLVPEPSVCALLVAGAALFVFRRRVISEN